MEASKIGLIIIILFLITGGIILYFNNGTNKDLFTSITTIPQVGQGGGPNAVSGTPSIQMYSGDIVAVSFSPLQYKSAIPVTIHENGAPLNLYVTEETNIYTSDEKLVPRSYLREGMVIQAQGIPVDGGIDVSSINILQTPTESLTPESKTLNPTPTIQMTEGTITETPSVTPSTSPMP